MAKGIRIYWTDQDDPSEGVLCTPADPLPYSPLFEDLVNPQPNVQNDVYGLMGFPEVREWVAPESQLNWTICEFLDYCTGPFTEGIPTDGSPCFRFNYRWVIFYNKIAGTFSYGRVGTPRVQADPLLFPVPLVLPVGAQISGGFDANARMCFAFDFNATDIQIRRFVAGVPTTTQFAGQKPRLFFDGLVQPDQAQTDLVVYYTRAGEIYCRMQRDNWAVEYLQVSIPNTIVRVSKTDFITQYGTIYFLDDLGTMLAAQSAPYPPWRVCAEDFADSEVELIGGIYILAIVTTGPYEDEASVSIEFVSGDYFSIIVNSGPYDDDAVVEVELLGGLYFLLIVIDGPYEDEATIEVELVSGLFNLVIVALAAFEDESTLEVELVGGDYA